MSEVGIFSRIPRIGPTQKLVLECRKRAICVQGGLGSGKSLLWQMDALVTALDNPGFDILVVRKTYDQVVDSVIADLERNFTPGDDQKFPTELLKGGRWSTAFSVNDRRPTLELVTRGAPGRFHFRGVIYDGKEDPSKFGSMPFGAAYFEEFSDFSNARTFQYIDGRCRQKSGQNSYNRLMLVGNPPMDSHWSQDEFRRLPVLKPEMAENRAFFILPTRENAENLPKGYIENIKQSYSDSFVRRYLDGESGIIEEGQPVLAGVYAASTRDGRAWHVMAEVPSFNERYPVIRAWDFGVAFMACVWMQYIPTPTPHIVIHHAQLGSNTSAYHFGFIVKPISQTLFPGARFIDIGDPTGRNRGNATRESAFSVLSSKHGIEIIPAPTNAIDARINVMMEMFSRTSSPGVPFVRISPSGGTQHLRDALEVGWAYKRGDGGFISPTAEPLKNHYSHPADATGYGLCYIAQYGDSIDDVGPAVSRIRKPRMNLITSSSNTWMGT